jgi:hypothetical protein
LRTEQNARPSGACGKTHVEPLASSKVANPLTALPRVFFELRGDGFQTRRIAYRGATNNPRVGVLDESDDGISRPRKP